MRTRWMGGELAEHCAITVNILFEGRLEWFLHSGVGRELGKLRSERFETFVEVTQWFE